MKSDCLKIINYWAHKLEAIERSNKDSFYRELIGANNFDSHNQKMVNWNPLDDWGHKLKVVGIMYKTIEQRENLQRSDWSKITSILIDENLINRICEQFKELESEKSITCD